MAKRTLINDADVGRLTKALMATKDWEKAKAVLPDVDPKALDRGWKTYCFAKAGLPLPSEEPAKVEPAKTESGKAEVKKDAKAKDPLA